MKSGSTRTQCDSYGAENNWACQQPLHIYKHNIPNHDLSFLQQRQDAIHLLFHFIFHFLHFRFHFLDFRIYPWFHRFYHLSNMIAFYSRFFFTCTYAICVFVQVPDRLVNVMLSKRFYCFWFFIIPLLSFCQSLPPLLSFSFSLCQKAQEQQDGLCEVVATTLERKWRAQIASNPYLNLAQIFILSTSLRCNVTDCTAFSLALLDL